MGKLKYLAVLAICLLIGAAGAVIFKEYVIPTVGTISKVTLSIKWLDGTDVTTLDWGTTDNATEYVMEPINITNLSNIPVTLILSTANPSPTIISLSLTWNYTGATLQPNNFEIVELCQNVTVSGSYSYNTNIRGEQS